MSARIDDEDYRTIEAVLRQDFANAKRKMFVIREQATSWTLKIDRGDSDKSKILSWRSKLKGLSESTALDFLEKNKAPGIIERKFAMDLPCHLLSEAESKEIWQRPDQQSRRGAPLDGWKIFREKYPTAFGVVSFSLIGTNTEKSQALVEVGFQADWLMGYGHLMYLERGSTDWKISGKLFLWIS